MTPVIKLDVEHNGNGTQLQVNAAEAEVFLGGKDTICIQMCDVMAFDNGDGDPITGATIEMTYEAAEKWVRAINAVLASLNTEH